MKPVFVFTVVALLALGAHAKVPSACDSCKSMVQTFIEGSKDQMKMTELKMSLSMLCSGTSHQSDCHKTLDKLDFIAFKLSPYLADTKSVCSKLQMCGDHAMGPIARLAMLYLKKAESIVNNDVIMRQQVCDECQASSMQLGLMCRNHTITAVIKSSINQLVCRSAGKAEHACNIFVSHIIPGFMNEMRDTFEDKMTMCSNMGLCSNVVKTPVRPVPKQPIGDLFKSMGMVKTSQGEELMSCFECTLSADTLLEEFIDKRQGTADDIQKMACAKMVDAWKPGCNDFVHMYMSTVLFLTYNQFDGRGICTAMHSCEKKENPMMALAMPERVELGCANCRNVEAFIHQNHEELHAHAVDAIYSNVCQKLPTALGTMCEASAIRMSKVFFTKSAQLAGSGIMCSQLCSF